MFSVGARVRVWTVGIGTIGSWNDGVITNVIHKHVGSTKRTLRDIEVRLDCGIVCVSPEILVDPLNSNQTVAQTTSPVAQYNLGDKVEIQCWNGLNRIWSIGVIEHVYPYGNSVYYRVRLDNEMTEETNDLTRIRHLVKTTLKSNHNCPKCGDAGEWISCALVCRNGHGVFAG